MKNLVGGVISSINLDIITIEVTGINDKGGKADVQFTVVIKKVHTITKTQLEAVLLQVVSQGIIGMAIGSSNQNHVPVVKG